MATLDLTPGTFNWTAGTYYDDKEKELYVGDFFQVVSRC